MLEMKTVKVIELGVWDDLVVETYGRPYNFQQQDDCKPRGIFEFSVPNKYKNGDFQNDSVPENVNDNAMGVSFKSWLKRDPNKKLDGADYLTSLWWDRNFYPHVDMVIHDLNKKGLLPEGDYLINIDW